MRQANIERKIKRFHTEIDLQRKYHQGKIEKDACGYYTYENVITMTGEAVQGEKFYIEDTYRYLEIQRERLHEKIQYTLDLLQALRTTGGSIYQVLPSFYYLAVLDYKRFLVDALYQGIETDPDQFLSPQQVQDYLEDAYQPDRFLETLQMIGGKMQDYPLLGQAIRAIRFALDEGEEEIDFFSLGEAKRSSQGFRSLHATTLREVP